MKAYLKKFGVWEIMVNPPAQSNKKTKSATQKNAKKDNAIALKFLMDGLSSSVRESVGEHTSAKDLWFKLESEYQGRNQETNNFREITWSIIIIHCSGWFTWINNKGILEIGFFSKTCKDSTGSKFV